MPRQLHMCVCVAVASRGSSAEDSGRRGSDASWIVLADVVLAFYSVEEEGKKTQHGNRKKEDGKGVDAFIMAPRTEQEQTGRGGGPMHQRPGREREIHIKSARPHCVHTDEYKQHLDVGGESRPLGWKRRVYD